MTSPCTAVGKAKIIQGGFTLNGGKIRILHMLRLVLNVMQYYNVILKVIAKLAAATTIAASEERGKNARYVKIVKEL
jgi:hypothetical protein